jgi:hypothetical protein
MLALTLILVNLANSVTSSFNSLNSLAACKFPQDSKAGAGRFVGLGPWLSLLSSTAVIPSGFQMQSLVHSSVTVISVFLTQLCDPCFLMLHPLSRRQSPFPGPHPLSTSSLPSWGLCKPKPVLSCTTLDYFTKR